MNAIRKSEMVTALEELIKELKSYKRLLNLENDLTAE